MLNPSALSLKDKRYCLIIVESIGCSMLIVPVFNGLKGLKKSVSVCNFANLEKKIQY